ncbi:MAG: tetratricopeptide repeat protein [Gammaproteobacteria bacterium]|nr:tetratricopeptide repeat protein [Gammaproteobacteria bacterium]
MTVIGGGSYARNCYMSSTLAIQLNSASDADIEECNQAILHGRLTRKDLLATYVNRGILYGAMEDYQKALKDYRTAIDLGPETGEVYVNLGNLYLLSQKYDVAIEQYTTGIELTLTKDHIAHFNRAMAYENNKEFANAEADYRRAIELSPEWVLPQLRLERLLKKAQKQNT